MMRARSLLFAACLVAGVLQVPATAAPAGPTTQSTAALHVARTTTTSVTLGWKTPASAAAVVIRYAAGGKAPTKPTAGLPLGKFPRSASKATAKKLTPGSQYAFALFTLSSTGKPTGRSTVVAATQQLPATGVTVTQVSAGSITVQWTNPNSSSLRGSAVRYQASGTPASPTGGDGGVTVGKSATSVQLTGLQPATQYTVAVFALGAGTSAAAPATTTGRTTPAPGSYGWSRPATTNPYLYVARDGTELQDIAFYAYLECYPNSVNLGEDFTMREVAIAADGTFTGSRTSTAVERINSKNYPASYSYEISGHITGTKIVGTFQETVTYTSGGTQQTCTNGAESFTITREDQPAQTTDPPPSGEYHTVVGSERIGFSVNDTGDALIDLTVYSLAPCVPSNVDLSGDEAVPSVPLAPDGSFSGVRTFAEPYPIGSHTYAGTTTVEFTGHFHSIGTHGAWRAAGTYRVTLSYDDGQAETCTNGDVPWYAEAD